MAEEGCAPQVDGLPAVVRPGEAMEEKEERHGGFSATVSVIASFFYTRTPEMS